MSRARPKKARRSRYSVSYRLTHSVPAAIIAVVLLVVIVGATLTYKRLDEFVRTTTGHALNPVSEIAQVVERKLVCAWLAIIAFLPVGDG